MSKIIVVDPFDYVVVGGTGDLAKRKLFPALFHRELDGQLPDQARIIGVARSELSDAEFVTQVEAALREFVPEKDLDADTLKRFLGRFAYMPNNAFTVDGYRALKDKLDEHPDRVRVIYLATPPSLFGPISAFLAEVGLNGPKDRLALEKLPRVAVEPGNQRRRGWAFDDRRSTGSTTIWARVGAEPDGPRFGNVRSSIWSTWSTTYRSLCRGHRRRTRHLLFQVWRPA